MFEIIITLDYELPVDGKGDVRLHMIDPTAKLLDVCEHNQAKLTIMAEIGELWAFEKAENTGYMRHVGYDAAGEVRSQLAEVIRLGHDVQLHLHPQWINARWKTTIWALDYSHYQLTDFTDEQMCDMLRRGKENLETLLRPHSADYKCVGFRAGHWNTQPSDRYLKALFLAGLKSDSSVFKWGYENNSAAQFDYRNAFSNVHAWFTQADDINQASLENKIIEVPIATELVRYFRMLTPKRIWLARKYFREDRRLSDRAKKASGRQVESQGFIYQLQCLFGWHPKKLDFCKLTGGQMLSMVKNLVTEYESQKHTIPIPLVMIGHSKHLGSEKSLGRFLVMLQEQLGDKIRFTTYREYIRTYQASVEIKEDNLNE